MKGFIRKVKYVMSKEHSIDIDDIYDFELIEIIMNMKNTALIKANFRLSVNYETLSCGSISKGGNVKYFNRIAA